MATVEDTKRLSWILAPTRVPPQRDPVLIHVPMGLAATASPVGRIAPQRLVLQAHRLTSHRRLYQRPVHGLPFSLNPMKFLIFFGIQAENPGNRAGAHPVLKMLVDGAYGGYGWT